MLGLVLFSNQVASTCFMALNTFHALPLQMFSVAGGASTSQIHNKNCMHCLSSQLV
jgi:hypothetical protein